MLKRLRDKFHMKENDNKGSAIVVVILAIAFVGMLVAMIAYMSYMNYLMKHTDRGAKDNFYSAETALDEINVGIQNEISSVMTSAYTDVMKTAGSVTEETRSKNFRDAFIAGMNAKMNPVDPATGSKTKSEFVKHLMSYWIDTPINGVTSDGSGGTIKYGAELTITATTDTITERYVVDADEKYLTLKGVRITYTDEKGFVSIIQTDIVIEVPDINFDASTETPELQTYSLIANNSLVKSAGSKVDISGSVYGGQNGIDVSNSAVSINFKYADEDNPESEYVVTAESLNVSNGAAVSSGDKPNTIGKYQSKLTEKNAKHQLWVENINVETASINLNGGIYVKDDLNIDGTDINGNGSSVTLKGSYLGYGDVSAEAQNSSSILINGAKTTLDMSGLDDLMLAGHAYVGAMHYDIKASAEDSYIKDLADAEENPENYYEPDESGVYSVCPVHGYIKGEHKACPYCSAKTETVKSLPKNEDDIILGQSIATKSDQMIYMVPVECMCYDNESGEQVLAKNPLTYAEYIKFTQTYLPKVNASGEVEKDPSTGETLYSQKLKYRVVDLGKTFNKLNTPLQATYGVSYKEVFRKVNGSTLVYYYLFFESESQANQFFADYYAADPDTVNAYAKNYIKDLKLNPNIVGNGGLLSLGGNALQYGQNGNITMVKSTYEDEAADATKFLQLQNNRDGYNDTYVGLSHYLLKSGDALTADQLKKDVYNNIVIDESEFVKIVPAKAKKTFTRTSGSDTYKAVAVNNAGTTDVYKVSECSDASIVLASGDVLVDQNFTGLIIAGGNIEIAASCNSISHASENVISTMMAKDSSGNNFYKLLRNGIVYANALGIPAESVGDAEAIAAREKDYIVLSDLIQYDNWSKE